MIGQLRDRLAERDHSPFFDRLNGQPPAKRYLIATAGRSGSTLLCSRISEYGQLGFPNEFLNEAYITEFDRLFPNPSLADFEDFIARSFSSEDGVFGLKTDWWRFYEARKIDLFRGLYEPLDLAVYLWREDFVAQAVSSALASATHLWHAREGADADFTGKHEAVPYDPEGIERHARNIMNQEYHWQQFLKGCGAPVVNLRYEDISRDVDGGVQLIADAFDLRLKRRNSPPSVRRARSDVGEAWRERFRREKSDFVRFWTANRGLLTATP